MQGKTSFLHIFTSNNDQTIQLALWWQKSYTRWLLLTGPNPYNFSSSIADQERLRRAHLLSALFPLSIVALFLFLPDAILDSTGWPPIILLLVIATCSLFFNRKGWCILSGLTYIFAIDAAIVFLLITEPHGIRNSNIPDLDLFIMSILITSIILPRSVLLGGTLFHIFLVVTLFIMLPHDPLLSKEIQVNQSGMAYSEISDTLRLLVFGSMVGFLTSYSVDKALARASRVEELAQTRASLQEKNQLIFEQNQRLEYGINVIKETLSRSANKDYSVRAILTNNELAPLAMGLNLMIERLSRMQRIEQEHHRLEQALHQLLEMRARIARNDPYVPSYHTTGTITDQMYLLFERYHHLVHFVMKYQQTREYIQVQRANRNTQTSQLTYLLSHVRSLAYQLQNSIPTMRVSTITTSADLVAIRKGMILPDRKVIHNGYDVITKQSERQLELISEANKICTQIQVTEKICMQALTELDQWLHKGNSLCERLT
jgi:hypothetical protein